MQLEVEFETLAEVEGFWAAIPPAEHKAWSQRAQVGGPPQLSSVCSLKFGAFKEPCINVSAELHS